MTRAFWIEYLRYRIDELKTKCIRKGFKILANKNVDFALFFLLFILCRITPKKERIPDIKIQAVSINKVLNEIIYGYEQLENKLQNLFAFPIGISNTVIVQKV